MKWYEYLITTGIPTIAIIWVGCILKAKIKMQGDAMKTWKKLVDSVDSISKLHDRETIKLKEVMIMDIDELRTQVTELASVTNKAITVFESQSQMVGSFFDRREFISINLPNCHRILSEANSKYSVFK